MTGKRINIECSDKGRDGKRFTCSASVVDFPALTETPAEVKLLKSGYFDDDEDEEAD